MVLIQDHLKCLNRLRYQRNQFSFRKFLKLKQIDEYQHVYEHTNLFRGTYNKHLKYLSYILGCIVLFWTHNKYKLHVQR